MDRTPKPGEFYRHFKNNIYQILAVATHSETREKLVVYQALYGNFGVYARPLDMFISEVDHEKYPLVTQKYRFEKIQLNADINEKSGISSTPNAINSAGEASTSNAIIGTDDMEGAVNPGLLEFLDADSFEEKYNVLVSMRDTIDDKLIDDIAVVMDVVIPEGKLDDRYEDLKNTIRTRQRYEFSNRLR